MFRINDRSRKWWILAAMGGVLGLVVLDETVVGVALPTIRNDLGMSQVTSHWVINAYLLVFTGFAAAGGKLGDVIDVRGLFVAGVAVSWENYGLLIPPLVIWGATLPFLYVPSRRAVMNAVPVEKKGQAGGINLTAQLLGGTIGMTLCGTLLATTGDFQIVFLVTAGITLAVLVLGWFFIER